MTSKEIDAMKSKLITPELAELAGIHAGDGYLRYLGRRKEWDISGSYEEKDYYDNYIIPLVNRVFDLKIKGKYFFSRKTYGFCTGNNKLIQALIKLGFPSGSKSTTVSVPKQIMESNDKIVISAFLRGYFDTDGCINFVNRYGNYSDFKKKYHYYPRLFFTTCSKILSEQIIFLLKKFDINCKAYIYNSKIKTENVKYKLQAVGSQNLKKWIKEIGAYNSTKTSRYLIWKKFGFCPTNTTYEERLKILSGNINIKTFYDNNL